MDSRREHVPFDPYHFEKQKREGASYGTSEVFRRIYETNHWSGPRSVSGAGSGPDQTRGIGAALPGLLEALGVDVLLDLPCGDFGWLHAVPLPVSQYVGADIVPALVERNRARFARPDRAFLVLDLTADPLPAADLLLCRDCLVHLSFEDIRRALGNVARSPIPYLLTTTFPEHGANEDITTGDWRLLNLEKPPSRSPLRCACSMKAAPRGAGATPTRAWASGACKTFRGSARAGGRPPRLTKRSPRRGGPSHRPSSRRGSVRGRGR